MRSLSVLVLFAALVGSVPAADPSPFPLPPPSPVPMPAPAPAGSVINLTPDLFYVFSAADADLVALPAGLVTVSKVAGPVTYKGRFANGTGAVETRTFPGPFVYSVDALPEAKGRVHLTLVLGVRKVGDPIATTCVDVNGGQAPQPPPVPPKPVDPVVPDPVVPKPVPVTSFRVIFIVETADTLTAAQRAVVYGKAVEEWTTANCTGGKNGWRRRDKSVPGDADPTMAALWAAIQPNVTTTPAVAVEVNGKVEIIPVEATPAKMIDVLKTYRGGK
jgi:hypothetical protein